MTSRIPEDDARRIARRYLASHPARLALMAGDQPRRRHHSRGPLAGLSVAAVAKLAQNVIIWKGR